MRGGYQIVDMHNINITNARVAVDGIGAVLLNSDDKAIMMTNLRINNVQYNDIFVVPERGQRFWVVKAYNYLINIDVISDDVRAFEE